MSAPSRSSAATPASPLAGRDAMPLVERGPQLDALRLALLEAEKGRGACRFVAGEGGIGKTRLLAALMEEASRRDWKVMVGRAYPVETGVPYAVLADAFVPLLRELPPSQVNVLTRGGLGELTQLFPTLGAALERAPAAPRGDLSELKARLLWTFTQLLARLATQRPLLVALENLQWADASSLELLHFAARQLAGERVVFVASYNSAERDANEVLRRTEHSLASLGVAETMTLAPLSVGGVLELLRRSFGVQAGAVDSFARRLHARTAGNPFFVEETLKALVESQRLERRSGTWVGWDVEDFGLPRTVRDTVLARLAGLGTDARRVADLASVIGTRVTHGALAAVSALPAEALLAAVDELRRRHVLAEVEEGGEIAYDFAHPTLRDALYGELGLARARTLHVAVAAALERHWGAAADAHADELAFHYARGEAHDEAVALKAMRYLEAAGASAAARHAAREAADYLRTALATAERAGDDAAVDRITSALARARLRLGEYDEAIALWQRSRERAQRAHDDAALAEIQRSLGLAAFWTGRFAEALACYDEGVAAAERAGGIAARVGLLVARGMCQQAIGRGQQAERDVRAALALAESLGEPRLLARAHRALLLLLVWTGPADAAREHGARAIALSAAAGDRASEWSVHWALAILAGLTGHATEVARHLADAERLAAELHSPLLEAWTAEVSIEYHSGIGEWGTAVAIAERTIAVARSLGQRTLLPRVLVWAGLLHFGRGELERGRECVDEAWALSGAERLAGGDDASADPREVHSIVPAHIGRAALHLARKEWAMALEVGERGLRIADRSGYVAWSIHRLMPIMAEAALWHADHDRARELGRRLREESDRLGHPLGLAWANACVAVQEMLKGDRDRSVELLREAAEALESIPYVADAARVRRQLARALRETGDREGALRELRAVHGVFDRLGAAPELEETREWIRALGGRPPVRAGQGLAGLTGRELDIVRHVARRRSNKEIGVALGISARTVSTHLSNIFGKLGVGSRGELTDLAREQGWVE
ncbi:MAG TPA: AAA family ATPase [Gemmatimonadaceae bacterium]|nr:AAA family ATPase [Gemmatimonadaceae bacterium]